MGWRPRRGLEEADMGELIVLVFCVGAIGYGALEWNRGRRREGALIAVFGVLGFLLVAGAASGAS